MEKHDEKHGSSHQFTAITRYVYEFNVLDFHLMGMRLMISRKAHAKQTPAARMERLRNLQAKIDDLDRRGLLRRKQFEGGIPLTERVVGFHVGRRG